MELWKIFLVDDDAEDRNIVEEALQTVDPDVTIRMAENGHDGLKLLNDWYSEGRLPCVIVLDVNMPKMNGPEMLSKLKDDRRFNEIPVIIYSTSINPYEKEKCIQMGAHSYITKPVTYRDSIEIARVFLDLCEIKKPL
jgi:CheY-like chemotaxis protein